MSDKEKRDYRVFWQHTGSLNSNTYPKQEPLMTYQEAKDASDKERESMWIRSWVIGRDGLSA
jgi:hypothetical protein